METIIQLTHPNTRGDKVLKIQRSLINMGYLNSAADGIFGPNTQQAVKNFQASAGITVDGIVGPDTFSALQECENVTNSIYNGMLAKSGKSAPLDLADINLTPDYLYFPTNFVEPNKNGKLRDALEMIGGI